MFYLLNQKFAEDAREATFNYLYQLATDKLDDLDMKDPRSAFDEIIEIIEELKVQATSHAVSKPAVTSPAALTVVPSEEVKF
jgi:hypothetical protein